MTYLSKRLLVVLAATFAALLLVLAPAAFAAAAGTPNYGQVAVTAQTNTDTDTDPVPGVVFEVVVLDVDPGSELAQELVADPTRVTDDLLGEVTELAATDAEGHTGPVELDLGLFLLRQASGGDAEYADMVFALPTHTVGDDGSQIVAHNLSLFPKPVTDADPVEPPVEPTPPPSPEPVMPPIDTGDPSVGLDASLLAAAGMLAVLGLALLSKARRSRAEC